MLPFDPLISQVNSFFLPAHTHDDSNEPMAPPSNSTEAMFPSSAVTSSTLPEALFRGLLKVLTSPLSVVISPTRNRAMSITWLPIPNSVPEAVPAAYHAFSITSSGSCP